MFQIEVRLTRTGAAYVQGVQFEWIEEKSLDAPELIPMGGLYEHFIPALQGWKPTRLVQDGVTR